MKITADQKALSAALKRAAKVAPKKHTMPIMAHVGIEFDGETATIIANDGRQTLSQRVPAEGDPGTMTAEADKLSRAVSGMKSGEVEIGEGYIKQGRSRLKLEHLNYDQFPQPDYDECEPISDSAAVIESLSVVQHAMANNDVRYYLNGILLSEGNTVATDGHRMAFVDSGYDGPGAIIPNDAVTQIANMGGTVKLSERQIIVDDGDARFSTKLIEGKYPDWQRVIPQNADRTATFNRDDLIAALRTAQLGGDNVKLSISSGAASLTNDDAHTECDCDNDQPGEVAFKGQYLVDALSQCDDSVTIQFGDSNNAVLINGFAVVMPVRM